MNSAPLTVADDIVVSLSYVLQLDNDEIVDSAGSADPLEYLQGAGNIIPGLEQQLYGMAVGDEKKVTVVPADAYGEYDPEAMTFVPIDAFPTDLELEEGMGLQMRDSNTGEVVVAYVEDIQPNGVVLNLNHPLAGQTLHFQVQVVNLRQATSEELAHGHVHNAHHSH
ncbi:MAG: peptidylprolyl isomerase [Chloroflexi bacterium]|nr:peptidylprolyl isomerase [Chloroflexota bacterium]